MAVTNYEPSTIGKGPWKWGTAVRPATKQIVAALLWTLHDLGGSIEDSSGRCPVKLMKTAASRGMAFTPMPSASLSQLIQQLDGGRYSGAITRECVAKRTYKITLALAPDEMPPRPRSVKQQSVFVQPVEDVDEATAGGTGPKPSEEPVEPPESPVGPVPPIQPSPTGPRPDDPNVLPDLTLVEPGAEAIMPTLPPLVAVADDPIAKLFAIQAALQDATMAVAAMPPVIIEAPVEQDDEMANRLAATLEENNRLRRKLNEATETLRAKGKELDAYKKQILLLQNNLKAIQDASNNAGKVERDLARLNGNQRFISQRPEPAIAARR